MELSAHRVSLNPLVYHNLTFQTAISLGILYSFPPFIPPLFTIYQTAMFWDVLGILLGKNIE